MILDIDKLSSVTGLERKDLEFLNDIDENAQMFILVLISVSLSHRILKYISEHKNDIKVPLK